MAEPFVFAADSVEATDRFGAALAECLPPRATIALHGTLGAGKTRLTQAIGGALGVAPGEIVSPTFVLCHEHHARRTIYHLDAYRIADDDEFLQLGVDDYFDDDALVLIEWAERVERCLPRERLDIHIEPTGATSREITTTAVGAAMQAVVDQLAARLSSED
ncbi:MAG: tRNA (adenosine(37)-N6)-threonylcarbamoyltransferase complex ATPase subunit type 1 TsaE [Planctomycetales bacterium]|nr:tRNA (adenosine(37)-N6)-threonylcarbamoyltransferase complex ATPase subunit type 1 TsaE [Planctomycetales bacterium]